MSSTRSRKRAGKPGRLTSKRPGGASPPFSSAGAAAEGAGGVPKFRASSGNVFRDLGFSPEEAANLKLRADLMIELGRRIDARGLTQKQAAKLLGVSQPRVSDLVRGKINLFSIDMLISMLSRVGVQVRLALHPNTRVA